MSRIIKKMVLSGSLLGWAKTKPPTPARTWLRGTGAGGLVRIDRPDQNAAVAPLIPLCPSLLHAAELRKGETPLGRAKGGVVRDVARVGQPQRAGAGRRGEGAGGRNFGQQDRRPLEEGKLAVAPPGHRSQR